MHFRVYPLELEFRARSAIHFPALAANTFRGALGLLLREFCSDDEYQRLFAPRAQSGPSGLADPPRPFVIRAEALNGQTLAADANFTIRIPLFTPAVTTIRKAFASWDRAELLEVRGIEPLHLSLVPPAEPVVNLRLHFLTPTELKAAAGLAQQPDFSILAARLFERISTLSGLYGDSPLAFDFQELGGKASLVRMTRCDVTPLSAERRSSRTGQTHPLGGFVGEAHYEGDLTPFVPLLRIGQWTGVGRQTVWGKGALRLVEPEL
jgi:hypothetical protein